ncbi:MAG: NAD(P)-dependent oxidoreductase [Pseudomonadota bacterium]
MRTLVTGSSGHLGEAILRVLRRQDGKAISIDLKPGAYTDHVGSITDPDFVDVHMKGVDAVLHTASLHKPHVATHSRQDFVDTNITGTLTLLEAARRHAVSAFVFTSTTSTFGDGLTPPPGAPAAWITEDVVPRSKNIYGMTKLAAEDLCWLFHRRDDLPCIILRTSRFFPEDQDDAAVRRRFSTENSQAIEFLHRRVDIEDVVSAHLLAADKARNIGFGRYVISATTPFRETDLMALRTDAAKVVRRYADFEEPFAARGWSMYDTLDRVYVNQRARDELGWRPIHDFATVVNRIACGGTPLGDLARAVGVKGYHDEVFEDGPFPVEA